MTQVTVIAAAPLYSCNYKITHTAGDTIMTNANQELTIDQLDQASGGRHIGRHTVHVSPYRQELLLNKQINAQVKSAVNSLGSIHLF